MTMFPPKIPVFSDRDRTISDLKSAEHLCRRARETLGLVIGPQDTGVQRDLRIAEGDIRGALRRLKNVDSFDEKKLPFEAK